MLYGFSGVICKGALSSRWAGYPSVVLAVIIGLISVALTNRLSGPCAEKYTTLVRRADLLMLLIFYGLQVR